jgi:hypothetical protein
LAAALTAVALLFGQAGPATAATQLAWGYRLAPSSRVDARACVSSTRIWLSEYGKSGVTRLKAKFERRAPQDPGIPGTSYGTRGWYYSGYFPNDAVSYWSDFSASFRYPVGGVYKIRAVLVGERPSLWQRDLKIKVDLSPTIGCELGGGFFS